ncbi:MAG: hypothetical protein WCB55_26235, partial [Pseudolabrys sp.]
LNIADAARACCKTLSRCRSTRISASSRRRALKPSHSTRTKRKAIANIQQYVLIRWRSFGTDSFANL